MAVSFASGSDYLHRTTGLLPTSGDCTVCIWTKPHTNPVAAAYNTWWASLNNTPATYTHWIGLFQISTPEDELSIDIAGTLVSKLASGTVDTWVHEAYVRSGTTNRYYRNGTLIGSFVQATSTMTAVEEVCGGDTFGTGDCAVAYLRQWTSVLTQAQIRTEMGAPVAVLTTGNVMDCSFVSNLNDASGSGHNWTQVGSGSFVAGPSLPSNYSAATATAFGTLPQTITQDFGEGHYAWYSYTGHADEIIAGFWAHATIPTDSIVTTVYESDGVTPYPADGIEGTNVPLQVPQASGQLLYFYVHTAVSPPTTDVVFSAVPGPTSSVPTGSIFTNDDTTGFNTAAIISSTTGANYTVLRYVDVVPTQEENGGDVLADGTFLIADDVDTNTLMLYSPQFEFLATVATVNAVAPSVRTCLGEQVFYVAGIRYLLSGFNEIVRVDGTGVVTDHWDAAHPLRVAAASNDGTLIYVARPDLVNTPVNTFVPATSTYTTNLAGAIGTSKPIDIIVMGDDSIVVLYKGFAGGFPITAKRYDAAGTVLNTYSLSATDTSNASLFYALDDPNSFWARTHFGSNFETCAFYNIKASDGSILATILQETFLIGEDQGTATLTPNARFGLAPSCPSFILREAIVPPTPIGEPVDYIIRRERWWPHISSEQFRQFFSMLQVDLFAGNGITAGPVTAPVQGEDPLLEVDWSDDGGHIWSSIHFVHTGKIGAYRQRAILRRMGYSRDRVYRIAVSDPNQWVIVNGYLQAVLGTS